MIPAAYDQVKLTLSRLNSEWSISGGILSPHAAYLLRRDADTRNPLDTIGNLVEAYAHITMAAAHYIDPATGEYDAYAEGHKLDRWNQIYAGMSESLLSNVIDSLSDEQKIFIQRRMNEGFSKANSIIQLMG